MTKFITYKCDLFLDIDVKGNLSERKWYKEMVYSFSPHIVKNYVENPNWRHTLKSSSRQTQKGFKIKKFSLGV